MSPRSVSCGETAISASTAPCGWVSESAIATRRVGSLPADRSGSTGQPAAGPGWTGGGGAMGVGRGRGVADVGMRARCRGRRLCEGFLRGRPPLATRRWQCSAAGKNYGTSPAEGGRDRNDTSHCNRRPSVARAAPRRNPSPRSGQKNAPHRGPGGESRPMRCLRRTSCDDHASPADTRSRRVTSVNERRPMHDRNAKWKRICRSETCSTMATRATRRATDCSMALSSEIMQCTKTTHRTGRPHGRASRAYR
jgi:hypothetical protein